MPFQIAYGHKVQPAQAKDHSTTHLRSESTTPHTARRVGGIQKLSR